MIVVLAAAFALASAPAENAGALKAYVHDGDGNTTELALDADTVLEVHTSLGTNTIAVEGATVRVCQADCPNLDCTQQAPISQPGQQLICLPHKLWVEIRAESDPEGHLDVQAVQANESHEGSHGSAPDLIAR